MALANMTKEETNHQNREHCKMIADNLEAIIDGRMYKCPNCGEWVTDNSLFCDCGEQVDLIGSDESEPWEKVSLYDWASDILDIEYRCGSDRQYRSCRIMVACGGPNIYIDTASKQVELYWWTDRASYLLSYDAVDAVDEWAEEYWNCL